MDNVNPLVLKSDKLKGRTCPFPYQDYTIITYINNKLSIMNNFRMRREFKKHNAFVFTGFYKYEKLGMIYWKFMLNIFDDSVKTQIKNGQHVTLDDIDDIITGKYENDFIIIFSGYTNNCDIESILRYCERDSLDYILEIYKYVFNTDISVGDIIKLILTDQTQSPIYIVTRVSSTRLYLREFTNIKSTLSISVDDYKSVNYIKLSDMSSITSMVDGLKKTEVN